MLVWVVAANQECLSLTQGTLTCLVIPGARECEGKQKDDACGYGGFRGKCRSGDTVSSSNASCPRETIQLTPFLPQIQGILICRVNVLKSPIDGISA